MTKPSKVAVIPQKFSGRSTEDPFKYLQNFELAAHSNLWADDLKLRALPNYLSDTALLWYHSYVKDRNSAATVLAGAPCTAKITWAELTSELQKAFRTVASKEVAEEKLYARKQLIGESPEDYVYSKLDLINDYEPNMAEDQKIRHIIKGLRASYLEKIHIQAPKTVEEVITAIRKIAETQYMIAQNLDSNVTTSVCTPDHLKELLNSTQQEIAKALTEQINAIKADISNLKNPILPPQYPPYPYNTMHIPPHLYPPAQPSHAPSNSCRYCKRTGHTIDQCRSRPVQTPNLDPNHCRYCKKSGHTIDQCKIRPPRPITTARNCHNCKSPYHFKKDCPHLSGNDQRQGTPHQPTLPTNLPPTPQ